MFVGLRREAPSAPGNRAAHTWALRAAWSVVIACLGYRLALVVSHHSSLDLGWLRLSDATLRYMKQDLGPLRLAHFLSAALLVATYLKSDSPFLQNRAAAMVIQTGRFSLEVFCLSAVVDVLLNIWAIASRPSSVDRVAADLVAMGITVAVVTVLASRRERRRAAKITGARAEA